MPLRSEKPPRLDSLANAFLGNQEAVIVEGQKADEKKQLEMAARQLLFEACDYGDVLVKYVAMHGRLSPAQAAWGFALALLNVRSEYPEGGDAFDDLAEQARQDLELAVTTEVTDPERIARTQADAEREAQEWTHEEFTEAATFAENMAEYFGKKKRQQDIDNKQAAYGLGRAFHNLRLTFPADHGGSAAFDVYAKRAGVYLAENKE